MLPSTVFVGVHRSYLVVLNKMDYYTYEEINIGSGVIPIGKIYRQQVLQALTETNDGNIDKGQWFDANQDLTQ